MGTWEFTEPHRLVLDEPVTSLDVNLIAGRINIVAADGPARVEVTRVGSRPVHVAHVDGRLTVRQERLPRWPGLFWWLTQAGRRMRCDVSIAVPADTAADLRMTAGDAVVSGLRRRTAVDVTAGHITLLGLAGQTTATVVSGGTEALGLAGEVRLTASSGDLSVADSRAQLIDARTVSGALTCDLDNPRHSDIRLETVSGDITVRVRDDSDLIVHLHTVSGTITSAFEHLHSVGTAGLRNSQGRLGAGTGRLAATATSGRIALLARPALDEQPVASSGPGPA